MRLVLIGGVHDSFECRVNLVRILNELAEKEPFPKFVAVEYGEDFFNENINPQRSLAALSTPKEESVRRYLSTDEMTRIADVVAYDAVSHLDVFPNVPTIWLDNKREYSDIETQSAGSLLYNKMVSVINFKTKYQGDSSKIDLIDEYTKTELDEVGPPNRNILRDEMWVEEMAPHLTLDLGEYGIVIVGADHTKNDDGLLRPRLRKLGHGLRILRTF